MSDIAQETAAPRKVIRDNVHNLITLDGEEGQLILELLDSQEMQRLRRIRQLGVSCLTFPGAEHSRLAHCLGTYHIARRMLDALCVHYGETSSEYAPLKQSRKAILCAALLHDVGHGPFSHVFEHAAPKPENADKAYPKKHEQWSARIIRERLADVLRNYDVDDKQVERLIIAEGAHDLRLGKDFISSQLDADRMDYLLRDSRAAGPRYGQFDLEWILHALRIGNISYRGQTESIPRLCFDGTKAVHVVEEYIQAREFMYCQVYMHKTTRAYEAMLRNVLQIAVKITDGNVELAPKPCPPALAKVLARQMLSTDEYLSLDDFELWTVLKNWATCLDRDDKLCAALRNKCSRLVWRGQPYRAIDVQKKLVEAATFVNRLENEKRETAFSCHLDRFEDLAYRNVFYIKSEDDEEEPESRAIYLIDKHNKERFAEDFSEVIEAISKIKMRIYRLYYDTEDDEIVSELKKEKLL